MNTAAAKTMDLFPIQTADFNQLFHFFEALHNHKLITTRCNQCQSLLWPPRTLCPQCATDQLEWVELQGQAELLDFVAQEVGVPPGFAVPLVIGRIRLTEGIEMLIRIESQRPDTLVIGQQIEFLAVPLDDGRVTYAFQPLTGQKLEGDQCNL